jgi:hypothetical protein
VSIFVGPDKQRFELNMSKLTLHTSFFVETAEYSAEPTLDLEDEDPETFVLFVAWVLKNGTEAGLPKPPRPTKETVGKADTLPLVKLWLLAERYKIDTLKNQAMDRIRRYHRLFQINYVQLKVDIQSLEYALDHAWYVSKLREYFCAKLARTISEGEFLLGSEERDELRALVRRRPDAALELLDAFSGVRGRVGDPSHRDVEDCQWHEHYNDTEKCEGRSRKPSFGTWVRESVGIW